MPRGASYTAARFAWSSLLFLATCSSLAGWSPSISSWPPENMPEREYTRLTRARRRAKFAVSSAGSSSLWLGKDHLLCIDTTGYTEAYKRFYFRDIQALSLRKTDGYKWWSLAFPVLALAFFLPAMLSSEPVVKYIFGSVAGLLVLLLLIHLALG